MGLKEIRPFYIDEDGVMCINACCSGANADPIRAARLAAGAKAGDKAAAKELEDLNSQKMYEWDGQD